MARRFAWIFLAGLWVAPLAADDGPFAPPAPPTAQLATPDELALAAACLERGEETAAVNHLSRHLAANPDRPLVRFTLAELLWRRQRQAEAAIEFGRFICETPPQLATVSRLVHAHTRLVAVAEQAGDAYGEHLHRGIGLYLLAGQDLVDAESLLCKAAGELTLAARERPSEARPELYLHLVWAKVGQSQPAEQHRARAAALAVHADLSALERRDLTAAGDASRSAR